MGTDLLLKPQERRQREAGSGVGWGEKLAHCLKRANNFGS